MQVDHSHTWTVRRLAFASSLRSAFAWFQRQRFPAKLHPYVTRKCAAIGCGHKNKPTRTQ